MSPDRTTKALLLVIAILLTLLLLEKTGSSEVNAQEINTSTCSGTLSMEVLEFTCNHV